MKKHQDQLLAKHSGLRQNKWQRSGMQTRCPVRCPRRRVLPTRPRMDHAGSAEPLAKPEADLSASATLFPMGGCRGLILNPNL